LGESVKYTSILSGLHKLVTLSDNMESLEVCTLAADECFCSWMRAALFVYTGVDAQKIKSMRRGRQTLCSHHQCRRASNGADYTGTLGWLRDGNYQTKSGQARRQRMKTRSTLRRSSA
jgi:hypothetical protein